MRTFLVILVSLCSLILISYESIARDSKFITTNTKEAKPNEIVPKEGVNIFGKEFPWELVIDRGKIIGCIYDNKFYSLGSILIEETLPRKCELDSARYGIWIELDEAELVYFKQSLEEEEKRKEKSTNIGPDPLSFHEARIIRYMRMSKELPKP